MDDKTVNLHLESSATSILPNAFTAEEDEDRIKEAAQASREKALIPLIEDVSDWLNRTLGITSVSTENFLESLDNGIILCQLIKLIQKKQDNKLKEKIKFNEKAGSGGWHARDNAATFLMWCRHFGVKQEILFVSDGLVNHTQKREVVLCLLELARVAARYKIEPPGIIKLEKEIEKDEKLLTRLSAANGKKKGSSDGSSMSELDNEVLLLTGQCKCQPALVVEKLRDGIYTLGTRRCLVRQFRGRHIMVRVGGGWDTLDNYLSCHDPCRVFTFQKHGGQESLIHSSAAHGDVGGHNSRTNDQDQRFLHVKGRYVKSGKKTDATQK